MLYHDLQNHYIILPALYFSCGILTLTLISFGVNLLSGSMETGQQNLEDLLNLELVPRKIGDDGSYYECVACDNGGVLLCCETCPNVYHLWCLNPPLEHVPSGEWRCSNCKESHPSEVVDEKEYDTKISKLGKAIIAPLTGDGVEKTCVSRKGRKSSELNPLKVYRRSKFKKQARKEVEDVQVTGSWQELLSVNTTICKHEPRKKDKGEIMPLELLANVCTSSRFKNIRKMPSAKEAFGSNKSAPNMQNKSSQRKPSGTNLFDMQYLEIMSEEHAKEEENWTCEEELDSLWIGVRRHGQGSWETILNDSTLKFSYFRTPTSLEERWKVERLKVESEIIQDPCISKKVTSPSSMIPPDGSPLLSKKRVAINNGKAKAKKRLIIETSHDCDSSSDNQTLKDLFNKRKRHNNGKAKAQVILETAHDRETSNDNQTLKDWFNKKIHY